MIYQLLVDQIGIHPIVDHWYGDLGDVELPHVGNGHSLVSLLSLRATVVPELSAFGVERLYFPVHTESDYHIDTHYYRFAPRRIERLTDGRCNAQEQPRIAPRSLSLRPLSLDAAKATNPHHFVGDHPVNGYWDDSLQLSCCDCGQPMQFALQFDSDSTLDFRVFDGETIYFGWCKRCRILASECHTW